MILRINVFVAMLCVLLGGLGGCAERSRSDESPVRALLAKLMGSDSSAQRKELLDRLSSPDADQRREGVYQLADREPRTWEVTPRVLGIMAKGDASAHVRAAAVQVLADVAPADTTLYETLAATAADESPLVRDATVKALAALPGPASRDLLLERLEAEPDPAVRSQAARALGAYPERAVALALIDAVESEDFSVSYRAREALVQLTGEDMGYDGQAWRRWVVQDGQHWLRAEAATP